MTTPHPMSAQRAPAWKRQVERSNVHIIRFMVWLSLLAGRRFSRIVVYGIAAYFFIFGGAARGASKDYLRRGPGKTPPSPHPFSPNFFFSPVIFAHLPFLQRRVSLLVTP